MNENSTHTIDATGKRLGRVATEISHTLMGKQGTAFSKAEVADVMVTVKNAGALKIDDKKQRQKSYVHYTGHPGGKRTTPLRKILAEKGYGEALRRAVYGMLPANKLRSQRMKRLIIEE